MKNALFAYVLSFLVVLSFLAVVWIIFLAFFDSRVPIDVTYTHPITLGKIATSRKDIVEKIDIAPGESFWTYREYCIKHMHKVLKNERRLIRVDGDRSKDVSLPMLPTRVLLKVGECSNKAFLNEVPIGVEPGEYWFSANWFYTLDDNPFATFGYDWVPVRINVINMGR